MVFLNFWKSISIYIDQSNIERGHQHVLMAMVNLPFINFQPSAFILYNAMNKQVFA